MGFSLIARGGVCQLLQRVHSFRETSNTRNGRAAPVLSGQQWSLNRHFLRMVDQRFLDDSRAPQFGPPSHTSDRDLSGRKPAETTRSLVPSNGNNGGTAAVQVLKATEREARSASSHKRAAVFKPLDFQDGEPRTLGLPQGTSVRSFAPRKLRKLQRPQTDPDHSFSFELATAQPQHC